ncbi:MAG: hypothetical protein JSR78_11235 [Proteobacteria bacterium]|nr:hypothetical protein [Pseudomonadota bacterium]
MGGGARQVALSDCQGNAPNRRVTSPQANPPGTVVSLPSIGAEKKDLAKNPATRRDVEVITARLRRSRRMLWLSSHEQSQLPDAGDHPREKDRHGDCIRSFALIEDALILANSRMPEKARGSILAD